MTHTVLEAMLFTPNNIASLSLTLSVFESLPLGTMDNESFFFRVDESSSKDFCLTLTSVKDQSPGLSAFC